MLYRPRYLQYACDGPQRAKNIYLSYSFTLVISTPLRQSCHGRACAHAYAHAYAHLAYSIHIPNTSECISNLTIVWRLQAPLRQASYCRHNRCLSAQSSNAGRCRLLLWSCFFLLFIFLFLLLFTFFLLLLFTCSHIDTDQFLLLTPLTWILHSPHPVSGGLPDYLHFFFVLPPVQSTM